MSEDRERYTTEPDEPRRFPIDTERIQADAAKQREQNERWLAGIMERDQDCEQARTDAASVAVYLTTLLDRGIRRRDALPLAMQWQEARLMLPITIGELE